MKPACVVDIQCRRLDPPTLTQQPQLAFPRHSNVVAPWTVHHALSFESGFIVINFSHFRHSQWVTRVTAARMEHLSTHKQQLCTLGQQIVIHRTPHLRGSGKSPSCHIPVLATRVQVFPPPAPPPPAACGDVVVPEVKVGRGWLGFQMLMQSCRACGGAGGQGPEGRGGQRHYASALTCARRAHVAKGWLAVTQRETETVGMDWAIRYQTVDRACYQGHFGS
jgi:hypothetical protein